MQALEIHAGARALRHLREHGLRPQDVRAIPAAAGGPKGLVLNPLDRFIFGRWLAGSSHGVHLLGASIGAWRMATACLPDPAAAFAQMAADYIAQDYPHAPGRPPKARVVSEVFGARLAERFGGRAEAVLAHPHRHLHVFTSRGRHLLRREGRLRTPLGYLGAFATNAMSRKAMGGWLERVIFSDPREALPLHLHDFRTAVVPLAPGNLQPSLLASCSIPFWLEAVHDIPGAPAGAYWDGGITDYHLHLDYASMKDGLVLYPHFQRSVVPGWLDKALRHRHRASARLDNVVLLSPAPAWIATLPNAKLPDRNDFKHYGDDLAARMTAWARAVQESERLADEFACWLEDPATLPVHPLT
ncbi:MAG: phospholipase [Piscinibacter sp.]|nr:phospholipase [Piscinibacter sp.]